MKKKIFGIIALIIIAVYFIISIPLSKGNGETAETPPDGNESSISESDSGNDGSVSESDYGYDVIYKFIELYNESGNGEIIPTSEYTQTHHLRAFDGAYCVAGTLNDNPITVTNYGSDEIKDKIRFEIRVPSVEDGIEVFLKGISILAPETDEADINEACENMRDDTTRIIDQRGFFGDITYYLMGKDTQNGAFDYINYELFVDCTNIDFYEKD